MENLPSDLIKGSTRIEEDDGFYEEIEAPKFVDFTAPDRSRQDGGSWFCVRIGCDQQHEQVDPDALHKSFMLRVMAARSPNLRLRKALNRKDTSSISKCPHSAPTKSTKDRITRFSTVTAIPEKIGNTRLRNHPISSLRLTPKPIKAAAQPLTGEKALTTPRNKKCPSHQEPFRSVKYQKAPVAAPKNRNVTKALLFPTPKKTAERTKPSTPISDVCTEMKELKLGSLKKTVLRGRLCNSSRCAAYNPNSSVVSSKKGEEFATSSKKKIEGSILQEGVLHGSSNREIDGKLSGVSISTENVGQLPSSAGSDSKDSPRTATTNSTGLDGSRTQPNADENVEIASNRAGTETKTVENPTDADDNKENVTDNYKTSTTNRKCERLQFDACENLPQQAIKAPRKTLQENQAAGGKQKRTTNPKPFRLRTDERGIMREANLEKRHQLGAWKETPSVARCGDGMQNGARNDRAELVRFAGAKLVTNIRQCQKLEKSGEKARNKIVKVSSSSVKAPRKEPDYRLHGDKKTRTTVSRFRVGFKVATSAEAQVANNITKIVTCPEGKMAATIRKGPDFHKFHVPKGCIKRP